jgi:hypothetical protein
VGTCARCGAFICSACRHVKGDQVLCSTCAGRDDAGYEPTPWERRAELGLPRAWWETAKRVLMEPEKFWRSVRPKAPWQDALWFGWLVVVLAAAIAIPFQLLQMGQLRDAIQKLTGPELGLPPEVRKVLLYWGGESGALSTVAMQVAGVALYPVVLLITAAIIHVFAMLAGASKNGFGATVRALAYASVPNVFAGIPFVGGLCGIYVIVLEVWGVLRMQETTMLRALIAVVGPLLLLCCCATGGIIAAIAMISHGH